MIDRMTNKPVKVLTYGIAGPYMTLPVSQLDDVKKLLGQRGLPYSVDRYTISLNGREEVIVVNLGSGVNPGEVQQLLDTVP